VTGAELWQVRWLINDAVRKRLHAHQQCRSCFRELAPGEFSRPGSPCRTCESSRARARRRQEFASELRALAAELEAT
jgi:hypothetical protein